MARRPIDHERRQDEHEETGQQVDLRAHNREDPEPCAHGRNHEEEQCHARRDDALHDEHDGRDAHVIRVPEPLWERSLSRSEDQSRVGPTSHVLIWPIAPIAIMAAKTGVSTSSPEASKNERNACTTPDASPSSFRGTTMAIARVVTM